MSCGSQQLPWPSALRDVHRCRAPAGQKVLCTTIETSEVGNSTYKGSGFKVLKGLGLKV